MPLLSLFSHISFHFTLFLLLLLHSMNIMKNVVKLCVRFLVRLFYWRWQWFSSLHCLFTGCSTIIFLYFAMFPASFKRFRLYARRTIKSFFCIEMVSGNAIINDADGVISTIFHRMASYLVVTCDHYAHTSLYIVDVASSIVDVPLSCLDFEYKPNRWPGYIFLSLSFAPLFIFLFVCSQRWQRSHLKNPV